MKKIKRKNLKVMRADMADNTISALIGHLRHELELETEDPDCLKETKIGLIIDMIEEQTDAIEGIIYDTREYLSSVLPVFLAVGSSEGFGTVIKNSKRVPKTLKNSGFDAAFIERNRKRKEKEKIFLDPDTDMMETPKAANTEDKKLFEIYSEDLKRRSKNEV